MRKKEETLTTEIQLHEDALRGTWREARKCFRNAHDESLMQACMRTALRLGMLYAEAKREDWNEEI